MTTPDTTKEKDKQQPHEPPKQRDMSGYGKRPPLPIVKRPKDAPIIFYLTTGEQVRCRADQWKEYQYEHLIAEENSDIIIPKGAVVKIRAGKK
jgi:hypothetical protein